MNTPSRSDYYLMGITAAVRDVPRMFSRTASATRLESCQIKFTRRRSAPVTEDEIKRRMELSKAAWFGATGVNRKRADVRRGQPPKGGKK